MAKYPECEIDEWYHFVLRKLEGYSLIKDELISEERGQKNVFRRNHKGRSLSEKGVGLKLDTIAAGSNYHHGDVPIQERRQIFSMILTDRNTAALALEKWIASRLENARDGSDKDECHVHREIYASLLTSAGPEIFVDTFLRDKKLDFTETIARRYDANPLAPSDYQPSPRYGKPPVRWGPWPPEEKKLGYPEENYFQWWITNFYSDIAIRLPDCAVLCNKVEAEAIVRRLLEKLNEEISINHKLATNNGSDSLREMLDKYVCRISIAGGYDQFGGQEEDLFEWWHDGTMGIGTLFLKFPSLFDVAADLGWEAAGAQVTYDPDSFEEYTHPEREGDPNHVEYGCTWWHLSRPSG